MALEIDRRKDNWRDHWHNFKKNHECTVCALERARRNRVLHLPQQDQKLVDGNESGKEGCGGDAQQSGQKGCGGDAQQENTQNAMQLLTSPAYAEAIYITGFNHSATLYALHRARIFARTKGHQLLWIQAEDRPPFAHFGDYSKAALEAKKKRT